MGQYTATLRLICLCALLIILALQPTSSFAQTPTFASTSVPSSSATATPTTVQSSPTTTVTANATATATATATVTGTAVPSVDIFGNALGEGLKSTFTTLGTFLGALVAVIFFGLILWAIRGFFARRINSKSLGSRQLTISAKTKMGDQLTDDMQLFDLITREFAILPIDIRHTLEVLTSS